MPFHKQMDVLATAAKGIAEVISVTGAINVDFNDVNTVMRDSGVAIMGSAVAEGENRALDCVKNALSSPLLNDNDITGARYVLLNITYGDKEVLMDEIGEITDYIQDEAGSTADVIWGHGFDESLGDGLCVTLIATGFHSSPVTGFEKEPEKKVHSLDDTKATMISEPIESPVEQNEYASKEEVVEEEEVEEPFLKVSEEDQSQTEINWTISDDAAKSETTASDEKEEVIRHYLTDDVEEKIELENVTPKVVLSKEEQEKRAKERLERIQTYTSKLKSSNGIADLEKEPAYKRRDIRFDDVEHSSEEPKSKFTISETEENGEKRFGLKENNSFLHDNVD